MKSISPFLLICILLATKLSVVMSSCNPNMMDIWLNIKVFYRCYADIFKDVRVLRYSYKYCTSINCA
jgi:hypothetical protein